MTIIFFLCAIRSAPRQPAIAQPDFFSRAASRAHGKPQQNGKTNVAPAARIADQFRKKSLPRSSPKELNPAKTRLAASVTGREIVCQRWEKFCASVAV